MFAENISWVGITTNVVEPCDAGRNGVAGTVERQSVVALLQLSVRVGCSVDDSFIVAEHVAGALDRDS